MRISTPAWVAPALAVMVWACGGKEVLDLGGDAGTSSSSGGGSGSGSSSGGSSSGDSGFGVAFTQQYVMACEWQFVPQAAYATYFVATARYIPAPGGGTFDFTEQPLAVDATSITQIVGSAVTVNGSPVTVDGQGVDGATVIVSFGSLVIPADADPLQAGPIDVEGAALHIVMGPGDQICGGWSGALTTPLVEELAVPSQSPCVLTPTAGTAVTPVTQAQLTCP